MIGNWLFNAGILGLPGLTSDICRPMSDFELLLSFSKNKLLSVQKWRCVLTVMSMRKMTFFLTLLTLDVFLSRGTRVLSSLQQRGFVSRWLLDLPPTSMPLWLINTLHDSCVTSLYHLFPRTVKALWLLLRLHGPQSPVPSDCRKNNHSLLLLVSPPSSLQWHSHQSHCSWTCHTGELFWHSYLISSNPFVIFHVLCLC